MIEIRRVDGDDWAGMREVVFGAFGDDPDIDPDGDRRIRLLIDHAWVAVDDAEQGDSARPGGQVVAGAGTYDHTVVVPGGTLPLAGLTMVGVRATHRGRGLLKRLMQAHTDDAVARGYAISGLWASEAPIYGRYGYGIAAESDQITVATPGLGAVAIPGGAEPDAMHAIDETAARAALPAIYARALADRPGALVRSPIWWHERRFLESPHARGGLTKRRHVVAHRAGTAEPTGYLVYRQASDHDFKGKLSITELVAVDPRAEASLWRFALSVSLFPNVSWWNAPVDALVPHLVADPRKIVRTRTDTLWLRILDVPRALAARAYRATAAVTFALDDEPARRYRFTAPTCEATAAAPDVTLTRAALSGIFLGGIRARDLARAGAIRGDATAIEALDRAFAWPVPAYIPEVF